MRKFALALTLLPLCGCQSLTWRGHGADLSSEQRSLGIKDIVWDSSPQGVTIGVTGIEKSAAQQAGQAAEF